MTTAFEPISNKSLIKTTSYIGGLWLDANDTFDVVNPFDNSLLSQVSNVEIAQVEQAVNAASSAQVNWQNTTAYEREKSSRSVGCQM